MNLNGFRSDKNTYGWEDGGRVQKVVDPLQKSFLAGSTIRHFFEARICQESPHCSSNLDVFCALKNKLSGHK